MTSEGGEYTAEEKKRAVCAIPYAEIYQGQGIVPCTVIDRPLL